MSSTSCLEAGFQKATSGLHIAETSKPPMLTIQGCDRLLVPGTGSLDYPTRVEARLRNRFKCQREGWLHPLVYASHLAG